jgi:transcriptional regulator with XRE-family HTH domain
MLFYKPKTLTLQELSKLLLDKSKSSFIDISDKLGLSKKTLYNWYNGLSVHVNRAMIEQIAELLETHYGLR